MTIKQRLAIVGIIVERAYKDRAFSGIRLTKNGHRCHATEKCSVDYAISLCQFFGV
jgi:hypothetical protein